MEEEVSQGRVLNEKLAASDSFVVSDDLKNKSQNDGGDGLNKTASANGVAVTFRLDQRRATMGGAFDAAAAGGGMPQPPTTTSPGGANEAPSPKKSKSKPTTPSSYGSANHETQKKRSKWRKSSSWSPKALQEELKKCELREGAAGDGATPSKKSSGSKKSRAKSKGSTASPLRKNSVNAVGLMSLDRDTVAERRANLFGSSSDSSWNRVGESHHRREGQGGSTETPAVAVATDEPLASSIVQELRKMKELKKQEEEEAIKEAESGKNKKKKKTMAATMRRKDKGRRKQEAVLPVLVDRALAYLEWNSADVDQPSLSEDMSGIQKKVLKCLKDALDSDLKHASKLQSALGSSVAAAGGTDPSGALSPRWGSGMAGSRVATMQTSTLSALKKDESGEWIVDFNAYDLTTVIAFIKYYLTEQPLIPEEIYQGLSAAIEIQFQSFRQNEIHSLLSRLPHTNLRILKRMLVFLSSISKNVAHKLTIGRVATCFATVLLQPAHLAVDDIKVERKDISLLRELIMNYAALFTTNQQLQFIERDGNLLVRYATLSKIVEKLVDESYSETEFADIIFLTHSYFTSAPELLRALANMHSCTRNTHNSHKDNNRMPTMATKNWQHRIRLRVLRLIRDWVDGYPEEILSNSEFMEKLQEFIQDKPAGLLGRNSQIEEEESMFLALSGWMQEAKSKQKALKEAAELRAKETASAATSTDNNSIAVGGCEVLQLAVPDTSKVHDEEVSDIEDDDLSGSDVELKFSDEDDDDESDGSDGEKSAVLQEPRVQKTGFALNLSQLQTTSESGVSLRRTPPMLAQMKRGPQMMSSSDFFDILAKGTQIMMKDQRVSAPSGLQRNQHAVVRKGKSAATTLEAKAEEIKEKETGGDSTNAKRAEEEEEKKEERKVSVLAELKAEKSEDEAKSEATSESETSWVPKKSEKAKKKKKRVSRSTGDSSATDEPKEKKKKKKKKRSAKSSITKHSSVQTKPLSLKSSLSENNVAHVLEPKKDRAAADQPPTTPPQPTVDSSKSRKAHSQEKKVKKSKKASKKKYQTLKKLSSKKSTETEQLIAGVHTAPPPVKDSNIADARLAEVLFDVEFPSTISADELLGTTTKKDQVGHVDSKQASPRVALVEPAAPANAPPLSPKTSGESTTVSAEMDAIDRDELLERIKDRTDLESQLLRHLINKERQMEREIDNLRKTVEKLVSAKVERFGLGGIGSSIKDDSSGNVPTRKADPIAAVAGGSGSSKKASLKSFKNDADTIVAAVPKDALLGGGSAFKVFAMDHVALAKELTLRDSELFRAINSRELIHKRFMKPDLSPTFQKMVLSFNEVGDWVLSEVLRYDTPADRGNAITTFIRICDQLWSLKNFNMLFAVLGGLNKTPVRRLKASWKKVPSKEMKIFKKQMTLADTEKNNSVYRHALRRAKPPLVPYLALFSKDLFSLEEGVPTTLSAEEDATISLINFDKLRLLYQLLKEFRQLQQTPYTTLDGVRGASSLRVLLEMTPPLEEKDSYTISYKWEPRQPQA